MIINHNMSALYANRLVKFKEWDLNKDIEKLSSGMRINRGGDDASGLAVSEKLRSQIRGLNQAGRNIENGISFIQVTEGYLSESTLNLRVRQTQKSGPGKEEAARWKQAPGINARNFARR
jgi:flagellin